MEQQTKRPFGGVVLTPGGAGGPTFPPIEIGETQVVPVNVYDAYGDLTIQAPLPGVLPDDVTIDVSERQLTISAKLRGGETYRQYYAHEWHYGPYERVIDLPVPVDATRANASFANGVLTISLPKASVPRPAHIELHRPVPLEGHAGNEPPPGGQGG